MKSESQQILKPHYETDIKLIGDKSTNAQIVLFLAYVRNMLKEHKSGEIKVSVGKNMNSEFFAFQVNDDEVPDIIAKDKIDIN